MTGIVSPCSPTDQQNRPVESCHSRSTDITIHEHTQRGQLQQQQNYHQQQQQQQQSHNQTITPREGKPASLVTTLPYILKPESELSATTKTAPPTILSTCSSSSVTNDSVLHNDTSNSSHTTGTPSPPDEYSPPPSATSLTKEFSSLSAAIKTQNIQVSTLHTSWQSSSRALGNKQPSQSTQSTTSLASNKSTTQGRPYSMPLSTSSRSSSSTFATVGTDTSFTLEQQSPSKRITSLPQKQHQQEGLLYSRSQGFTGISNQHSLQKEVKSTSNRSISGNPAIINEDTYFPDSSSYIASITPPAPNPLSLKPHHPQFPPATLESLTNFRKEAQAAPHDPALQLNFAKYLMEAVDQVEINDVTRATKAKSAMLSEAQRIVKTLAMQSRIGKSGYADAQFYLANAYGAGLMLLRVSHEKAFNLYIQGSKQCHAECTYRAGVCYELGLGTRKDNARAIRFYRKAANLGDPSAMYKLAMILLRGLLGQSKHPKEAISWLKRAAPLADAYHPEILHELGLAYEKEGIPFVIPDQEYARELLTKAARFGYAPSQYRLGLAYENGMWQCPIDPCRSIAWYSKAAEQGHLESALALSGWYLTGATSVLPQSDVEAYLWARKTADRGYAKGQYACGYYTEMGIGVPQNLVEARQWYQLAARQQYEKAINRLSELKQTKSELTSQQKQKQYRHEQQQKHAALEKSQASLVTTTATTAFAKKTGKIHSHSGSSLSQDSPRYREQQVIQVDQPSVSSKESSKYQSSSSPLSSESGGSCHIM